MAQEKLGGPRALGEGRRKEVRSGQGGVSPGGAEPGQLPGGVWRPSRALELTSPGRNPEGREATGRCGSVGLLSGVGWGEGVSLAGTPASEPLWARVWREVTPAAPAGGLGDLHQGGQPRAWFSAWLTWEPWACSALSLEAGKQQVSAGGVGAGVLNANGE